MRPSDARDMQNFYLEYYEKNIQALFKFLEDNRYFEGTYVVYPNHWNQFRKLVCTYFTKGTKYL